MLSSGEYEKLKGIPKRSIKNLRNEGWYFTTDTRCSTHGTMHICKICKWRALRWQVGATTYPNTVFEDKKFSGREIEEIRGRISSEIAEELEIP